MKTTPTIDAGVTSLVLDHNHPLSDLYYKKARYKVYWGGRGSAKSWGFAEALVRMAAAAPLRILCVREFQNSLADSSYQLMIDTIDRLNLRPWFHITEKTIRSKVGAQFKFRGLRSNNESGIRSTEGVDIVWAEEAHSISSKSWRTLLPTIREHGSEIWISFNFVDDDNATYKMFVGGDPEPGGTRCPGKRHDSIVHKVNYWHNPYFGGTLREEMETDKATDYEVYEHIWEGLPLRLSNEIIFSGKTRVAEFDEMLWKKHDSRIFQGLDFGFAQDPNAFERFFPIEKDHDGKRRLYVSHEAYARGVELDEMEEFLVGAVPDVKSWPIKADPARPETISYLHRLGFAISGAEKWEGCVKDGITHLRGFHEIVIHPRCTGLIREARLYRYKVDKTQLDDEGRPQVLPIIIDAHNHGWDAIRYGSDGYIMRSGALGVWARLAQ